MGMETKSRKPEASSSTWRNDARMKELMLAFREGKRDNLTEIISNRAENSRMHKKLKGKHVIWEDLKDEIVHKISIENDVAVAKFFDKDNFPFHEICGNIVGTSLLGEGGPFYVRTYDIGQCVDDKRWVIIMENIEAGTEEIDLDEPINLYNLLYQITYAVEQLHRAVRLQHFDLRFDNVLIKLLPQPRDVFKDGRLTSFIIKIGDWGQCEFDLGGERPENDAIPREEEYRRKWGTYPRQYSGYDVQYFLGTLTPVLDSLHGLAYYYIYNMTLTFLQPCAFTTAQDRPAEITPKMPVDILKFLREEVAPTL